MLRLANNYQAFLRKSSPIRSNGHPSAEPRGQERAFCDGDTATRLDLCEIAKVKRLTPQAEIKLAARMMELVGRFDPATGTRIATYSSRWIKHSINRALDDRSK